MYVREWLVERKKKCVQWPGLPERRASKNVLIGEVKKNGVAWEDRSKAHNLVQHKNKQTKPGSLSRDNGQWGKEKKKKERNVCYR